MRYASRRDANHDDIVKAYEAMGCGVLDMSRVGGGHPDIEVHFSGYAGKIEIKTEDGELNDKQKAFRARWKGPKIRVIRNVDEAIAHVREVRKRFEDHPTLYAPRNDHGN